MAELHPERAIVPIVRSGPKYAVSQLLGTAFCLKTQSRHIWVTARHVFEMSPLSEGEKYAIAFRNESSIRVLEVGQVSLSPTYDLATFDIEGFDEAQPLRLASQDPHLNSDVLAYEYSQTRIEKSTDGKLRVSFEPYSHKGHTVRRFTSDYPEPVPTPSCLVSFPALQGASGAPLLCGTQSRAEIVVVGMLVANLERELMPAQTVRLEEGGRVIEETKYFLPLGKGFSHAGLELALNSLNVVYESANEPCGA
jgi:hypothetical protein